MKRLIFIILSFILLHEPENNALAQNSRGAVPISEDETFNGKTYAIIIGISNYKNIPSLRFADRDALTFKNYLLQSVTDSVNTENIELFLNEQANRVNILDALYYFLNKIKKGDRAYFYFAGHGDIEDLSQSQNGLLLLYNAPERNYFGLTDEVLQVNQIADYFGKLSNIGADVIYIIDACHSGKLIGGTKGRSQTTSAIENIFSRENTLMLSCEPNQLSLEGVEWGGGHGIFSYYLHQGLSGLADNDKDNEVSLLELETYVKNNTYLESEKKQTPVFRGIQNRILNKVSEEQKLHSIEKSKKEYFEISFVNYKGKEMNYLKENDTLSLKIYLEFIALLNSNQLIRPYEKNAMNKCYEFCSQNPNNYLCTILKRKLITKLNCKFDSIVRPIITGKKPKWPKSFLEEAKVELDSCLQLLNMNHYLYPHILSRKYYLEAMICSYGININNYGPNNKVSMINCLQKLHQARQLEPNAAYIYFSIGRTHQTMLNTDSSMEYLIHFSNLIPNSALAHNMLGISYGDKNMFDKSIQEFQKAIQLDVTMKESYANLISMYSKINQLDSALQIAKDGLKISPDFQGLKNNLASLYMELGQITEAREIIYDNLKTDTINTSSLLLLGICHYKMKEYQDAKVVFGRIIQLQPDYRNAIKYLGLTYKSLGKYSEAIKTFSKYTSLDTLDAQLLYEIANCFQLKHQNDSTKYYLQKAFFICNENPYYHELLGDIYYYHYNLPEKSLNFYKKAIQLDSFNLGLLSKICSNALVLNQKKEMADYLRIIDRIPNNIGTKLYLKLAQMVLENRSEEYPHTIQELININPEAIWKIKQDPLFYSLKYLPILKSLLEES